MKLIIREYLALLKESDELDRLLPDLLLAMSIPPLTRAQKGVRQDGVDVAAVGKDPETKKKSLLLFVIKRGDIGRSDWDSGQQAVRPSLEEIKDVYLNNHIKPNHRALPKKIILCTGGDLKQEAQQNWDGYVTNNQKKGKIEYEFWGGDQLSLFIEKYLFNENILPNELRSKFRKTLALLSDPDYDYSDYYSILNEILLKNDYGDISKRSSQNKIIKSFRTINLCQNIIYYWAKNEGNIRSAIYCSERTVLNAWDIIRRYEIYENKKIISAYMDLYKTLFYVYNDYSNKVQSHCYVRNGFSGYNHDYTLECLSIFENLGFLSTAGLLYLSQATLEQNDSLAEASKAMSEALKNYISNQMATRAPCYDGHIIEISEAIFLLHCFQEYKFIDNWIQELIYSVAFAYHRMNKYFPIQSDSFDDLVKLNISENIEKKSLFELSTLIPILAQWCVALGLDDAYLMIQKIAIENFPDCTLQIWYPDEKTDSLIYRTNAAYNSGNAEAPISLDITIEEMKNRIKLVQTRTVPLETISACQRGLLFLPILSSRHFRTPFLPNYWQSELIKDSNTVDEEAT